MGIEERRREYDRQWRLRNRDYFRQWSLEHEGYWRVRYAKRKAQGYCVRCSQKALRESIYCGYHLLRETLRDKKRHDKYRGERNKYHLQHRMEWFLGGKCYQCGAPLMEDENKYCNACRASWHQIMLRGVIKYATHN